MLFRSRFSAAIRRAYEKGCLFDSWSECFQNRLWMEAFEECGVDVDFYTTRERSMDEIFPWDFINIGVSRAFLEREWKLAHEGQVTQNCRQRCSGCGAAVYGGGVCHEHQN